MSRPLKALLEIGPGTGYYTLPVAARLQPEGTLRVGRLRGPHTPLHARIPPRRRRGFYGPESRSRPEATRPQPP